MRNETYPLIDTCGACHLLQIQDDRLALDQRPVLSIRLAESLVIFETSDGQEIACLPEACWYAVAGADAAPNDFCDRAGHPWAARKQRKLFRAALHAARAAAKAQVEKCRQEAQAERMKQPHKIGQRRPMQRTPLFQGQVRMEGGQR